MMFLKITILMKMIIYIRNASVNVKNAVNQGIIHIIIAMNVLKVILFLMILWLLKIIVI